MALLNLGQATETIITILSSKIPTYADWPLATTLTASPAAPDQVNANYALSFYLYHVKENAHTKSQDWQVNDSYPLRYKSMGVTLYYILTPRSDIVDIDDRAYADQLTMGLALKTLNDFPYINDTTTVDSIAGPVIPMPVSLRGRNNRLRLSLQPTAPEEAVNYWQAGTQAARLAAYYEVNAILLEPDEIRSRSARVLSVGVHTFVENHPVIMGTRNTINVTIPGESQPREIDLSPAEATIGEEIELYGSGLKGDRTSLLLNHRDFPDPVAVDAAWAVEAKGTTLTATIQASAGAQAIIPGIYGAIVRTTATRRLPDGRYRDFDRYSNEVAFAITPQILTIGFAGMIGTIQVNGFEPHALTADEIMLFAGTERLTRTNTDPPPAGEFFTPGAPPADTDKIRFRLPAAVPSGSELTIRLVVRGAESAPQWEVAP
jgi:hypothetical protein